MYFYILILFYSYIRFFYLLYSSFDHNHFEYSVKKKNIHEITGELQSVPKVADDIFQP